MGELNDYIACSIGLGMPFHKVCSEGFYTVVGAFCKTSTCLQDRIAWGLFFNSEVVSRDPQSQTRLPTDSKRLSETLTRHLTPKEHANPPEGPSTQLKGQHLMPRTPKQQICTSDFEPPMKSSANTNPVSCLFGLLNKINSGLQRSIGKIDIQACAKTL